MLFATEGFESFNAIIRAKSILSNRLAPSRDIAKAFALESRVRHLMSGGSFFAPLQAVYDSLPKTTELNKAARMKASRTRAQFRHSVCLPTVYRVV